MSELIGTRATYTALNRWLLATVSAVALTTSTCVTQGIADEVNDRPTVWIELGGQFQHMDDGQVPLEPLFAAKAPTLPSPYTPGSLSDAQKPPAYGFGEEGKISFEPKGSDWVLSAAVLYGRANSSRDVHQSPVHTPIKFEVPNYIPGVGISCCKTGLFQPQANFAHVQSKQDHSDLIVDFQAGKDVGVGLFGNGATSVLSAGVRFAQFSSRSSVILHVRPDTHFGNNLEGSPNYYSPFSQFHSYVASGSSSRSFHGIGPTLSWNATAPFAGNPDTAQFTVDWGVNIAVLFGRQKVRGSHHTSATYRKTDADITLLPTYVRSASVDRSRTIVVPNVGGFAGASVRVGIAKVSLGYRADFFFGAMDSGGDAAQKKNVGFYGPFATISVGLGG